MDDAKTKSPQIVKNYEVVVMKTINIAKDVHKNLSDENTSKSECNKWLSGDLRPSNHEKLLCRRK